MIKCGKQHFSLNALPNRPNGLKRFVMKMIPLTILSSFFILTSGCKVKNRNLTSTIQNTSTSTNYEEWDFQTQLFPDNQSASQPSKEQTLNYIREIAKQFNPYTETFGFQLAVKEAWSEEGFSARVQLPRGGSRDWLVIPYGDPSQESKLTEDVLTIITCHELGHLWGGYPFHSRAVPTDNIEKMGTMYSGEPAADYFATKDCLPRLWAKQQDKNASFRNIVEAYPKSKCDQVYSDINKQNLCYRIATTSKNLIDYMRADITVAFETPSTEIAERTKGGLNMQERLDTLLAGALCPIKNQLTSIPGLAKSPDGMFGEHSVASELDANLYSCTEGLGSRPLSWFKPGMPDLEYFECGEFADGECIDPNTVKYCHRTQGYTQFTCEEGCVVDEAGAICKEQL